LLYVDGVVSEKKREKCLYKYRERIYPTERKKYVGYVYLSWFVLNITMWLSKYIWTILVVTISHAVYAW